MTDSPTKRPLGIDVLTAARQRIAWAFDAFPRMVLVPSVPVMATASTDGSYLNIPRKPGIDVETEAIGFAPESTSRI